MAFLDDHNPPMISESPTALAAIPTLSFVGGERAVVQFTGGLLALMNFELQVAGATNLESGLIQPNDRDAETPGRWQFLKWGE